MRFSEAYSIRKTDKDDWYDPILFEDTLFFVDPFLVYQSDKELWVDAHDALTNHFNTAIKLIAESGFKKDSVKWKKAKRMLTFPEPAEVCLGYAEGTTSGGGSGPKGADAMMSNVVTAVQKGLEGVESFEELALFGENVGADRISDIVINILKSSFIRYTQEICARHDIDTQEVLVQNASFDYRNLRWVDDKVQLPINSMASRPLILVPEIFLRDLPKPFLNQREFWAYAWENFNENIRDDFNFDLSENVDMAEIVRLARERPSIVQDYVQNVIKNPLPPYDMDEDKELLDKWWERGTELSASYGTAPPSSSEDFDKFILSLVNEFKHAVEERGIWELLNNDNGTPRKERAAQALFRSSLIHYCRAHDIDLTGEANAGRGPVDFKFSQGWTRKVVVEIKRANNTKFWQGLTIQTPQYMNSEETKYAIFVALMQRDIDFKSEREKDIELVAKSVSEKIGKRIDVVVVDSRKKLSASNM